MKPGSSWTPRVLRRVRGENDGFEVRVPAPTPLPPTSLSLLHSLGPEGEVLDPGSYRGIRQHCFRKGNLDEPLRTDAQVSFTPV